MEDAHVARTDVCLPSDNGDVRTAKVFAVFDGHGGAEVARFCQMNLVDVLVEQEEWRGVQEAATETDHVVNQDDPLANAIGSALIQSFHALDRLIDDPSKRMEMERWRSERPPVYVAGQLLGGAVPDTCETTDTNSDKNNPTENMDVTKEVDKTTVKLQDLHLIGDLISQDDYDSDDSSGGEIAKNEDVVNGVAEDCQENNETISQPEGENRTNEVNIETDEAVNEQDGTSDSLNDAQDGIINDDSDDETDRGEKSRGMIATEAYSLISKLLHMNSNTPDDDEDSEVNRSPVAVSSEGAVEEMVIPTQEQLLNPPSGIVAPCAWIPTKIMNGSKVCNLPDHPVHAGCTSVVAVILDKTVVVANAGDSRAVLCRAGGLAEPLSFDHKPLQVSVCLCCSLASFLVRLTYCNDHSKKREMSRIVRAGGFVNQFGRVNGNLNLSRSIGDLKYKQVPGIAPADQMITAEPDIISTTLRPGDEFIVLGCDGIWDCLSNEECVKYIHDRIDTKSPVEIGTEMLDEIVSDDPRASQGIGGDNMTVMIIDLRPQSRKYAHQ